jgi:tryptophan synthase beta chain
MWMMDMPVRRDPDARGYFGPFGGKYVPETLVEPIEELQRAYFEVRDDEAFQAELARLFTHYVGRPTPCTKPDVCRPRLAARASSSSVKT